MASFSAQCCPFYQRILLRKIMFRPSLWKLPKGSSDIGDFLTASVSRRLWDNHYFGNGFNVKNRSSKSKTCHQHKLSPRSVTNIELATRKATKRDVENKNVFEQIEGVIITMPFLKPSPSKNWKILFVQFFTMCLIPMNTFSATFSNHLNNPLDFVVIPCLILTLGGAFSFAIRFKK